ncbi:hypothetical protein [Aquabacterium sp.]|uniref:hypothetical protein n=1 Tax=Aquabacterium sp. TaxID=1872578 RepID=UPI003783DD8B
MGTYTITASAELMENYVQADVLQPQAKFMALQSDAGASLLLSISSAGVLLLTLEQPGQGATWRQVDLSSARIQADFGGHGTVKTFGAAQTVPATAGGPTTLQLAMVVNDGTSDHLYLSLGHSATDLSWVDPSLAWTAAPFNAQDGTHQPIVPPSPFTIDNVFISESSDRELIVVDTLRNPGQPVGVLSRYYLDAAIAGAPQWQPHDLPVDVQAQGYSSCLGRSAQAYGVDGLYTSGVVGGSAQLVYTPLYNAFDSSVPPLPSRLALPGGGVADAIAALRNDDNTSDLYVASQGALYWFAAGNQKSGAIGLQVATSALLGAVRALFVDAGNDGDTPVITVWGLNGNDQVFYLRVPAGQQGQSAAWSTPLPILSGVDAISPFINRPFGANTFFAHSTGGLTKLLKSPTTGLWSQQPIVLPPSASTQPATPIHSYTTHVQATDANGQAAPNLPLTITASNVTAVSINHLYYLVGPQPITVPTDLLGTLTIVELTTTLAGTRYTVAAAGQAPVAVNTMDSAWQRNAQYTSVASLQAAQIVNRDGSSTPFVPAGTSSADLQRVAASNQALAQAYTSVAAAPPPGARVRALAAPRPLALPAGSVAAAAGVSGLAVDIGDLFRWLESGIDAAIELVKDAANDVWHFVVTVGKDIYTAVLDCVEAVVAAATWVYNEIKIAVDDVLKFLQFLFGWQDILVTHRVLRNVMQRLGEAAIAGIGNTKAEVAGLFQQMQSAINGWADIPNFNQTATSTQAANPPQPGQGSAPSNLGLHHFQGGLGTSSAALSPVSPAQAILNDLVGLMQSEGAALAAAAQAIQTDIIEPFATLSVTDVIKRFLAIVTDTVLQTAENVVVTMLDVLQQLMQGMMDILTMPLDIPVLSWLYQDLTGDTLTFLDVICLITAIPATLIYKAAAQQSPFPANDAFTQGLIDAPDFDAIQALFVQTSPAQAPRPAMALRATAAASATAAAAEASDDPQPVMDQSKLKTFGFVTGIVSLVGGAALVVVTNFQRVFDMLSVPVPFAKTVATLGCVANIAYVSPNITSFVNARTDNWYANLNAALTGISILKGMAAIPAAAYNNATVGKVFAFVESFINVVWNVPVIANIVVNKDKWDTSYKSLIPESIGNFAFNIGGIMEFPIALISDPKAKVITAAVQAGFMVGYGVFMIIAGAIYEFAPNQSH